MTSARAGALALCLLAAPSAAPAQDRDEADHHFEAGVRLFRESRYQQALREFESSMAIRETASVVLNLASCLQELGRAAEAVTAYERFIRLAGPRFPEERARAERATRRLRSSVAELSVRTTPRDAALSVDGRVVDRQPVLLDLNETIVVEARRDGFRPARTTFRASAPGPTTISLRLEIDAPSGGVPHSGPASDPSRGAAEPEEGSGRARVLAVRVRSPARSSRPSEPGRSMAPWLLAGAAATAAIAAILVWALVRQPLEGDWTFRGP